MINKIKPQWQGFVPAYIAHPLTLCAYYHCKNSRWPKSRYCKEHAIQYDKECDVNGGKVIHGDFTRPSSNGSD